MSIHSLRSWRAVAVVASAGAAVIHFAVTREHLDEWRAAGLFMLVTGLAQLACAVALTRAPSTRLARATVLVNSAIVAVWIASRTTGLPVGPEHWAREAIMPNDLICSALEILAVVAAVAMVKGKRIAPLEVATVTIACSVAALFAGGEEPRAEHLPAFAGALVVVATLSFARAIPRVRLSPWRSHAEARISLGVRTGRPVGLRADLGARV